VITLAGDTHASRVGASLLKNVGLGNLVAATPDEYARTAVELANDVQNLQKLRGSLRIMMRNSPLTDAKRFTSNLEHCYRKIWDDRPRGVKA
jgi:protein O-GlcNAc transferase